MFKRLDKNPDNLVSISINGKTYEVPESETVAAAVLVNAIGPTRSSVISGSPRASFCLMGVCYECLMVINGIPNQRACKRQVEAGMHIETQQGPGIIPR